MEFFFLVFWGVAWGAVCGIVASNRGRFGGGWFMLGVLFSFLALIVLVCLDNPRLEEARQHDYERARSAEQSRLAQAEERAKKAEHEKRLLELQAAENTKACRQCAEVVKAAAKVCRFCQYSFEGGPAATAPV